MKRYISILLAVLLLFAGCTPEPTITISEAVSESNIPLMVSSSVSVAETVSSTIGSSAVVEVAPIEPNYTLPDDYVEHLNFSGIDDPDLLRYMEDSVYSTLAANLSETYYIENVDSIYISKEYLEEVAYNSQSNIFFGYTLAEIADSFGEEKFVFTVDDNNETVVTRFEDYDFFYEKITEDILIGSGVVLFCVTLSALPGGVGALGAVSVIMATLAKSAAVMAVSGGVIDGVVSGTVTGLQTGDMDEAMKSTLSGAATGFKWGAITGAIGGAFTAVSKLRGATRNGLTLTQAAAIQKDSKYPLEVINRFRNYDEYVVYKNAGLTPQTVNGKTALVQNIDVNYKDVNGVTNLEKMLDGKAPLDSSGKYYELHHIGQNNDSPLAILTSKQHHDTSLHYQMASEIERTKFDTVRKNFWQTMAEPYL